MESATPQNQLALDFTENIFGEWMKKYNLTEFSVQKREKLLDYKTYEFNFDEMLEGLAIVRRTLSLPKHELEAIPLHNLVLPLEQRAFDSLTFLLIVIAEAMTFPS